MKRIYDTTVMHGNNMHPEERDNLVAFYKEILSTRKIKALHDCSIGAGGTTLPFAKLGIFVSGSDLNENLLDKAKENFQNAGFSAPFFIADFTKIDRFLDEPVDCIASTGNSLPHVDLNGFRSFVKAASASVRPGGYLYFDIRNWDMLSKEHPILRANNPRVMTAEEHIATYLFFNWFDDGSVEFHFATICDKSGKNENVDILSAPRYYPLLRKDIDAILSENGFVIEAFFDMDDVLSIPLPKTKSGNFEQDFEKIEWYSVIAKKN